MKTEILARLGLTPGEIKIFLALLDAGSATTGEISRRSGVHTSKVYPILDRLMSKGLASYIYKSKVRLYQAVSPKSILELISTKRKELDLQEIEVKKLIQKLETTHKIGARQWAAVFEGNDGIKSLFEIMLDEWQHGEEYLVFTPGEEFENEELNKFFKKHHQKRMEKGVLVKVLASEQQRPFYTKEYAGVSGFEFRYTTNSLPAAINIVHNKVSTLVWSNPPSAFVIDSSVVAEKYRSFFLKLWLKAKE